MTSMLHYRTAHYRSSFNFSRVKGAANLTQVDEPVVAKEYPVVLEKNPSRNNLCNRMEYIYIAYYVWEQSIGEDQNALVLKGFFPEVFRN